MARKRISDSDVYMPLLMEALVEDSELRSPDPHIRQLYRAVKADLEKQLVRLIMEIYSEKP